jgi:hypothetical protein
MTTFHEEPQTRLLLQENGILVKSHKGRAQFRNLLINAGADDEKLGVFLCGPEGFVLDNERIVKQVGKNISCEASIFE